jgi:hypothetical protein
MTGHQHLHPGRAAEFEKLRDDTRQVERAQIVFRVLDGKDRQRGQIKRVDIEPGVRRRLKQRSFDVKRRRGRRQMKERPRRPER